MQEFKLRHCSNKHVKFLHIVNFVVNYNIMTFEEAHSLYKQFKLEKDVVFNVPDEMVSKFRAELNSLNCEHE
jgi:hypothetical protein